MLNEKKILTYAFFIIMAYIFYYQSFHRAEIDADTWAHLANERSESVQQQQDREYISLALFQQIGLLLMVMLIPVGVMIIRNKAVSSHLSVRVKRHEQLILQPQISQMSFSDKLLAAFPHLTAYDLTLCEMIVEKHTSKQIATALNISAASVNTARYRLRKKLEVPQGQELILFLWQYKA